MLESFEINIIEIFMTIHEFCNSKLTIKSLTMWLFSLKIYLYVGHFNRTEFLELLWCFHNTRLINLTQKHTFCIHFRLLPFTPVYFSLLPLLSSTWGYLLRQFLSFFHYKRRLSPKSWLCGSISLSFDDKHFGWSVRLYVLLLDHSSNCLVIFCVSCVTAWLFSVWVL